MIFTNLYDDMQNKSLSKKIEACIEFARNNKIAELSNGSYFIPDTEIKMNVMSYNTKSEEDGFWESHVKYIDVQIMLEGEEYIAYNNIYGLEKIDYKEEDDFCSYKGKELMKILFKKNDVLIFYPEDAHMTSLNVNESKFVKKVVFKVDVNTI